MSKILGLAVAAVIVVSSVSVYAGSACCAAGKAKEQAKATSCSDQLAKLNLTDSQKQQVGSLEKACAKATSRSECHDIMSKGLSKILTPEQYKDWNAMCDKAGASGCTAAKAQPKS